MPGANDTGEDWLATYSGGFNGFMALQRRVIFVAIEDVSSIP